MRRSVSALVGRSAELRIVDDALAAARAGRGGALLLTGERGIGKSRLAVDVAAGAASAGMCVMRGRGSTIGPTVPFRPLTEALLSALRLNGSHLPAALGPYRRVLGRLVPDWRQDNGPAEAGSLVVLGEAVLRLTSEWAKDRGCLMILDDLQDIDAETLAVMEYLFDNLAGQPTLLVAIVRDEASAALEMARAAIQRGSGAQLQLERLTRENVRAFAADLLGDVPEATLEWLWSRTAGHPAVVEELLDAITRDNTHRPASAAWQTDSLNRGMPDGLGRLVAGRADALPVDVQATLRVAAVFGERFPVAVVGAACGLDEATLFAQLAAATRADVVRPDETDPQWCRFHHPLTATALLSAVLPSERAALSGRAADAVLATFPELPDQWCPLAASLRADAGDRPAAARLFAVAGRRARVQGAATSAVAFLERSMELLDGRACPGERAEVIEELIDALCDAGEVERGLSFVGSLDGPIEGVAAEQRAALHTRLAWAACKAGRHDDGMAQIAAARAVLGPYATEEASAPVDVVAAHLATDSPDQTHYADAERLARRAAAVAERAELPDVACRAWLLLGCLLRHRDGREAGVCFERARELARRHHLPVWTIRALIHLGSDDALTAGTVGRLERARDEAERVGAVTPCYEAELTIAMHRTLFGEFAAAARLLDSVATSVTRLRLTALAQYALITRAVLAAHQCRRGEMDRALAELRRSGGDQTEYPPLGMGLARAFCALLEEDRPRANRELDLTERWEAEHATHFQLTGRYGLRVLLRVLDGDAGEEACESAVAASAGRARWNRQFTLLALAVVRGRQGRVAEAEQAAAEAFDLAKAYGMARHLGARLVAEPALAGGWGTAVLWLRDAEEYFFAADIPSVASACRALLRRAGEPVRQRRRGVEHVPGPLRSLGVTVREFEVLRLLVTRPGNRAIANRLHISPRTVEKHIASLMAKTGVDDRGALGDFAAQTFD